MTTPRTFLLASLAVGVTAGVGSAQVVSGVATGPVLPQASAPAPTTQVPSQFDPAFGAYAPAPPPTTTSTGSTDAASFALDFTPGSGSCGANSDQSIGWQFDLTGPITVTDMAWFDEGGNGLPIAHEVALWDPAGNMVPGTNVTIPAGTAATLDGNWRTVPITPVAISPGAGYIVGGYNGVGSAQCLSFNVTQTTIAEVSYIDATFSPFGPTLVRPTSFSGAVNGFYGVSFKADSGTPGTNCTSFELNAPCVFISTNPLTNQIAGLTFSGPSPGDGGAVVDQCGNWGVNARTGTNFLGFNSFATMANGGTPIDPETIAFAAPVSHVEIWCSGGTTTDTFQMDAFNASGGLVDSTGPVQGPGGTWTKIEVNGPGITSVVLNGSGDCCYIYDDLCWTPESTGNCTDFELGAGCGFAGENPLTNQIAGFVASGPIPGDGGAVLDTCGNFGIQPQSGVDFFAFNRNATMANGGVPRDPETITFNAPVSSASIVASGGTFFPNAAFRMEAFNGAALVDTDNVNGSTNWESLSVSATSITHIVLTETTGATFWVYDDMCWGGGPGAIGSNFQCTATVPNSSGQPGVITATGSETASDNDVLLTATQLPNNQFGYFLNSPNQNPGGFVPPGSQGRLCIGPQSIGRYNQPGSIFNTMGTGMGSIQLDLPNTPTPTGSTAITAGQTWYFTCWFRDNNPGSTSNFTDAVCITFN